MEKAPAFQRNRRKTLLTANCISGFKSQMQRIFLDTWKTDKGSLSALGIWQYLHVIPKNMFWFGKCFSTQFHSTLIWDTFKYIGHIYGQSIETVDTPNT